jgi:hypothetical protein
MNTMLSNLNYYLPAKLKIKLFKVNKHFQKHDNHDYKMKSTPKCTVIGINIKSVHQIFNSFDPSPFSERDVDLDCEDFILTNAEYHSLHQQVDFFQVEINIKELPSVQDYQRLFGYSNADMPITSTLQTDLQLSLNNHFEFLQHKNLVLVKMTLKTGQVSLAVGACIMLSCLVLTALLNPKAESERVFDGGYWVQVAIQALNILAWVSLWKPFEIFVYSWWPLVTRQRLLGKLAKCKVQVNSIS